jgi:tetratricopeptide (TPR) repeat protein
MRYSYVSDHWVYISSLGLIALCSALIAQLGERFGSPRMSMVLALILLPILGGLTWRHSADFLNSETLWRTTLARNPEAGVAYYNLGRELSRQGRFAEAVTNYQETLVRVHEESDVHFNLANALLELGRLDEAIFQYRKTLELQPFAPDAELNLGVALMRQGKISEATEHLKKSLSEWPASTEALKNLTLADWLLATSPEPTIRDPEYAVILASDLNAFTHQTNARIWRTLARAQAESGRFAEAVDAAGRGLQLAVQHNDKQAAEVLATELKNYQQGLTNKVPSAH